MRAVFDLLVYGHPNPVKKVEDGVVAIQVRRSVRPPVRGPPSPYRRLGQDQIGLLGMHARAHLALGHTRRYRHSDNDSKCFWLVRPNGSVEDFSYRKCECARGWHEILPPRRGAFLAPAGIQGLWPGSTLPALRAKGDGRKAKQ